MADGSDLKNSKKAELDKSLPGLSIGSPQGQKDLDEIPPDYATGIRLVLIMFTIFVRTLLVSLEIGIIATAIPKITNDFRKLNDVGWYGCATFFLAASTSPLRGKLFKYLNVKWVYLSGVGIFLVGSIVAAAAQNKVSVIIGRAIQGWGASGVLGGTLIVINYVAPPRNHRFSSAPRCYPCTGCGRTSSIKGSAFTTGGSNIRKNIFEILEKFLTDTGGATSSTTVTRDTRNAWIESTFHLPALAFPATVGAFAHFSPFGLPVGVMR